MDALRGRGGFRRVERPRRLIDRRRWTGIAAFALFLLMAAFMLSTHNGLPPLFMYRQKFFLCKQRRRTHFIYGVYRPYMGLKRNLLSAPRMSPSPIFCMSLRIKSLTYFLSPCTLDIAIYLPAHNTAKWYIVGLSLLQYCA